MLPTCVLIAAVFLARDLRLRVGAAILALPLLVAAYLTYNRAVFLALFALAVAIAWRIRRQLGIAVLAIGLVAGALLLPSYLALRGSAVGGSAQIAPGQVLIASDQQRLGAWAAAGRMFLDSPVVGQGYRAYRQLSVQFGDPVLNAPHNEWLRFFAEGGILNGIVGLAFIAITATTMWRRPGWLETGLFGAFLSLCIAAAFNNTFLFNQVTIPGFLMAGTGVALAVSWRSPATAAAPVLAEPAVPRRTAPADSPAAAGEAGSSAPGA
jgi:O-antigen ligase